MMSRREKLVQSDWRDGAPALKLSGINKSFGDSQVLTDIAVELGRGKVVALLGENGSGKSTLIKILSGFHAATPGGVIEVGGHVLSAPITPEGAHASGLRFVHQDLGLVEPMSIENNVCFATGFGSLRGGAISKRENQARVKRRLGRLGLDWDPTEPVSSLSPAQRTMLAIARVLDDQDADPAYAGNTARVLVLDEPTASLPESQVAQVFEVINRVKAHGGTVLYVSHRIDEVLEIADEVVVLRDGHLVAHRPIEGLTHHSIVSLLLGRELERVPHRSDADANAVRSLNDVALSLKALSGSIVQNVDLDLLKGELVGIGGLSGCGRSELVRLIAGVQERTGGRMELDGQPYDPGSPRAAIKRGVAYVPEDRRNHGCIGPLSLLQNLTLVDLSPFSSPVWLNKKSERAESGKLVKDFDIRPADLDRPIAKFSGGNQQKAVLAKSMRTAPHIVIVDEPTQGIDVGAKNDIAKRLIELTRQGTTVILASSENAELASLCDRLVILDRGRIKCVMEHESITEDEITLMTSGHVGDATSRT
jgi:ribose transport system ATP-binding protein